MMAKAPPKPIWAPGAVHLDIPAETMPTAPPDVTASWRGLWHALGSVTPFYINHSRASRKALRKAAGRHG